MGYYSTISSRKYYDPIAKRWKRDSGGYVPSRKNGLTERVPTCPLFVGQIFWELNVSNQNPPQRSGVIFDTLSTPLGSDYVYSTEAEAMADPFECPDEWFDTNDDLFTKLVLKDAGRFGVQSEPLTYKWVRSIIRSAPAANRSPNVFFRQDEAFGVPANNIITDIPIIIPANDPYVAVLKLEISPLVPISTETCIQTFYIGVTRQVTPQPNLWGQIKFTDGDVTSQVFPAYSDAVANDWVNQQGGTRTGTDIDSRNTEISINFPNQIPGTFNNIDVVSESNWGSFICQDFTAWPTSIPINEQNVSWNVDLDPRAGVSENVDFFKLKNDNGVAEIAWRVIDDSLDAFINWSPSLSTVYLPSSPNIAQQNTVWNIKWNRPAGPGKLIAKQDIEIEYSPTEIVSFTNLGYVNETKALANSIPFSFDAPFGSTFKVRTRDNNFQDFLDFPSDKPSDYTVMAVSRTRVTNNGNPLDDNTIPPFELLSVTDTTGEGKLDNVREYTFALTAPYNPVAPQLSVPSGNISTEENILRFNIQYIIKNNTGFDQVFVNSILSLRYTGPTLTKSGLKLTAPPLNLYATTVVTSVNNAISGATNVPVAMLSARCFGTGGNNGAKTVYNNIGLDQVTIFAGGSNSPSVILPFWVGSNTGRPSEPRLDNAATGVNLSLVTFDLKINGVTIYENLASQSRTNGFGPTGYNVSIVRQAIGASGGFGMLEWLINIPDRTTAPDGLIVNAYTTVLPDTLPEVGYVVETVVALDQFRSNSDTGTDPTGLFAGTGNAVPPGSLNAFTSDITTFEVELGNVIENEVYALIQGGVTILNDSEEKAYYGPPTGQQPFAVVRIPPKFLVELDGFYTIRATRVAGGQGVLVGFRIVKYV